MPVEPTWETRELPVLEAVVRCFERGTPFPTVRDLAEVVQIEPHQVLLALQALSEADPPYVDLQMYLSDRPDHHRVKRIMERGRRAVGQWQSQGLPDRSGRDSFAPSHSDDYVIGPVRPLRVFNSYSHKDERFRAQLEVHLSALQGLIEDWHDRKISPGDEWKNEIDEHLEAAHMVLLLISADFLASDYCYEIELTRALERHNRGETRAIPIILRHCDWQETPFARLQALPPDGKPVAGRGDRAWTEVAKGLRKAIQEVQKARSSESKTRDSASSRRAATPPKEKSAIQVRINTTEAAKRIGVSRKELTRFMRRTGYGIGSGNRYLLTEKEVENLRRAYYQSARRRQQQ